MPTRLALAAAGAAAICAAQAPEAQAHPSNRFKVPNGERVACPLGAAGARAA